METLTVRLGERSYPILFGTDLVPEIRSKVAELEGAGRRIAVVTDANVAAKQGAALRRMFGKAPLLAVPAGERAKTLAGFGRILDFLAAQKLDRAGAVFAVGGGVVGDVAGFAAASYLRGIDYFQVPTTLLAMVDSSVGGKTGVNLTRARTWSGPSTSRGASSSRPGSCRRSPPGNFRRGWPRSSRAGSSATGALRRPGAPAAGPRQPGLASVIRGCCAVKARVVEADERELAPTDGRALLNLGHTFGHAIEQATGYGTYRHGEAVAIGLVAAARLSRKLGLIPGPTSAG